MGMRYTSASQWPPASLSRESPHTEPWSGCLRPHEFLNHGQVHLGQVQAGGKGGPEHMEPMRRVPKSMVSLRVS